MKPQIAARLYVVAPQRLSRQPGAGTNYVDHWWAADSQRRLLFYLLTPTGGSSRYAPQCNTNRQVIADMYPGARVVFMPSVFVPTELDPTLMAPYANSAAELSQ